MRTNQHDSPAMSASPTCLARQDRPTSAMHHCGRCRDGPLLSARGGGVCPDTVRGCPILAARVPDSDYGDGGLGSKRAMAPARRAVSRGREHVDGWVRWSRRTVGSRVHAASHQLSHEKPRHAKRDGTSGVD